MEFMEEEFDAVGIKEMHPLQVRALMEFIGLSLAVAASTKDPKAVQDIKFLADDLVHLFGGAGVRVATRH